MKRIVIVVLPLLAASLVIGLGLFLVRRPLADMKPRIGAVREQLEEAVEAITAEIVEATA